MWIARWATAPLRWATAPLRLIVKLLALVVLSIVVYFAVTLVQVWLTSRQYAPVHAQAIVVVGAPQVAGASSSNPRSRLDQAFRLYQQGYAHLIVTTGDGLPSGASAASASATASATYLQSKGVPAADVLAVGGATTWSDLSQAASALQAHGLTDVLVVTAPFHEDRSMAIATDVGLTPHPTPVQRSAAGGTAAIRDLLRTAAGVALGRIVGYQHLRGPVSVGSIAGVRLPAPVR